jgi:hypothetical protein
MMLSSSWIPITFKGSSPQCYLLGSLLHLAYLYFVTPQINAGLTLLQSVLSPWLE